MGKLDSILIVGCGNMGGAMLRGWLAGPDGTARRLVVFNRCMATVLAATGVWMLLR